MDTLELRRGESGNWYMRIVSQNGNILFTSETYSSKQAADNSACAFLERIGTSSMQYIVREGDMICGQ